MKPSFERRRPTWFAVRSTAQNSFQMSVVCRCSVPRCTSTSRNSNVSFFRFPNDAKRAGEWAVACQRFELLDKLDKLHNSSYRICGKHFKKEMFANELRNRLNKHAVPTVMPPPEETQTQPVVAATTILLVRRAPGDQLHAVATLPVSSVCQVPNFVNTATTSIQQIPCPSLVFTNAAPVLQQTLTPNIQTSPPPLLSIKDEPLEDPLRLPESFEEETPFIKQEPNFEDFEPPQTFNEASEGSSSPNVEETTVSFILEEEPPSPNPLETSMPSHIKIQIPTQEEPKVPCHRQVQTTTDLLMQTPRVVQLKRSIKYLDHQNFYLKQKIRKLQEAEKGDNFLEKITFEDYKKLTYKFCASKEIAESVIDKVAEARNADELL